MRYCEIQSGMRVPISSDEGELLRQLGDQPVSMAKLDDRQRELARRMTSRGLLNYFRKDDQTFYRTSSANDIWRDRDDD